MKIKTGLKNKNSLGFIKKSLLTATMVLVFAFSPLIKAPQAHAWDAVIGALTDVATTELNSIRNGIMTTMAKQAAIKSIYANISSTISGSSSGGAMFVVDWKDFLFTQPKNEANKYVNDYLTNATKGRGSISGYIAKGSKNFIKFSKNYEGVGPGSFQLGMAKSDPAYARFLEIAQANTNTSTSSAGAYASAIAQKASEASTGDNKPQVTYYEPGGTMFDESFYKFSRFASENDANLSSKLTDVAQELKATEEKKATTAAAEKAGSGGGFIGTEKNGQTIIPGSLLKDMMSKASTASIETVINADRPEEIISGFVTAFMGNIVNKGLTTISKKTGINIFGAQSGNHLDNVSNTNIKPST